MISVTDAPYGAVGDGVTDDSAAFQSALNAAGWIYVPPGTYLLATLPLIFSANTRLTLDPRATLVRGDAHGMFANGTGTAGPGGYAGRGNIFIDGGGVIDGQGVAGVAAGIYVCMLSFGHATGITIRDITIRDVPGMHAIEINSSTRVLVDNVGFAGMVPKPGDTVSREAIQIDACNDVAGFGFGPYDNTPCRSVRVTNCWAGASGTAGTVAWPRGVGSHGTLDTSRPRHSFIRVDHNMFDQVTDAGVRGWWWDQSSVHDNFVNASAGDGIVLDQTTNTDVHDNPVFDSGRNGILVTNSSNIRLRGNAPVGSGTSADNTYDDIRVLNCSVVDIYADKGRKRGGPNHARWGLYVDSASTKIHRYGGRYQSSGQTGSISDNSVTPVTSASDAP